MSEAGRELAESCKLLVLDVQLCRVRTNTIGHDSDEPGTKLRDDRQHLGKYFLCRRAIRLGITAMVVRANVVIRDWGSNPVIAPVLAM